MSTFTPQAFSITWPEKMGLKCRTSARKEVNEKYREQYTFWGGVRGGGLFSLEPRGVDVIPVPSPATPHKRG